MSKESGWDIDFSALMQTYSNRVEDLVRMLGLRILRSVVLKSPVDTGRFRGNWHISLDEEDPRELNRLDKDGTITIQIGEAALRAADSNTTAIYIQNTLPYAVSLEYGHSNKAPEGMVRVTVAEINQWIEEIAARQRT